MSPHLYVMMDRDGTIIEPHHYLDDPARVELLPGAAEGMRKLMEAGFGLVVLTNQSAIERGIMDTARLEEIHQRMRDLLAVEDVHLDGIYSCPHHPDEHCYCRKPATGMAEQAAADLDFDPDAGFMIGDNLCDIRMGQTLNTTTFLVRTEYGLKTSGLRSVAPDYVVDDIAVAADIICRAALGQEAHALP